MTLFSWIYYTQGAGDQLVPFAALVREEACTVLARVFADLLQIAGACIAAGVPS